MTKRTIRIDESNFITTEILEALREIYIFKGKKNVSWQDVYDWADENNARIDVDGYDFWSVGKYNTWDKPYEFGKANSYEEAREFAVYAAIEYYKETSDDYVGNEG